MGKYDRMIEPPPALTKEELRQKLARDTRGVLVQVVPPRERTPSLLPTPRRNRWERSHVNTRRYYPHGGSEPRERKSGQFHSFIRDEGKMHERRYLTMIGGKYMREQTKRK